MTDESHGDPRVTSSRRTIINATIELLVERGFVGATIEAVAARSGAAKTTIYRHWHTKHALLVSAVESILPAAEAPDTGSFAGDVRHFVTDLAGIISTKPLSAVIPGLIEAAEHDTELERLLAEFTARRRYPIHTAVARGIARGELSRECDPELVASTLLGPLFYRRLLTRQSITTSFADNVVRAALAGFRQDHQSTE